MTSVATTSAAVATGLATEERSQRLGKGARLDMGQAAAADRLPLLPVGGWKHGLIDAVGHDVDDALCRRPASRLPKDIHNSLQVLVIDRLVDARRLPAAQLGERHKLAAGPFHLHAGKVVDAGTQGTRQANDQL